MRLLKRLGIAVTAMFLANCSAKESPRPEPIPSKETHATLSSETPASKPSSSYTVEYEEFGYTMFMGFKKEGKSYALFRFDVKGVKDLAAKVDKILETVYRKHTIKEKVEAWKKGEFPLDKKKAIETTLGAY